MILNCYRKKIRPFWVALLVLSGLFLAVSCSEDNDLKGQTDPDQEEPQDLVVEALPQIEIVVNSTIPDEPKIRSSMKITEGDKVTYNGIAGIEIRGASSQMFDKKSYGLETWDSNNEDINVSLLGMPEEEDWVLYGPYSDKSLIRNKLIYDLARDMGRYASRTRFVELTINDEYKGVYVFMEKLKRDKERIDIEKLKSDENSGEDLTGGYILKIDKIAGSNVGEGYNNQNSFTSKVPPVNSPNSKIRFLYEYPDAEDITDPQKDYIQEYIYGFEAALSSDNFKDPELGYAPYIDVSSFVDFFILNEIANNVDGFRLSTFMHKDMNGKLKMGPIWDFNLGFGNANYCEGGDTDVWAYKFNERCPGDFWLVPFWWERLLKDPRFVQELKDRWNQVRGNELSDQAILSKLEAYNTELVEGNAINENFSQWQILGQWIWPNEYVGNSYSDERTYLQEWVTTRLSWLDGAIGNL